MVTYLRNTYFLILVAITLVLAVAVPEDEITTVVALSIAWLIISVVMRPRMQTAGQGAVVMLTVMLAIRNYSGLELDARAWGLLALSFMCLPFVFRPLEQVDGFPFLHVYCLIEGIYVYISLFIAVPSRFYESVFTPEVRTAGFRALALFLGMIVLGGLTMGFVIRWAQRASGRSRPEFTVDQPPPEVGRSTLLRAYAVLGVAGVVTLGLKRTGLGGSLGTATELLQEIAFGGWLVLVYLWMSGRLRPVHKVVVLVVPLMYALATIGDTRLYQAATPGFLVLALWLAMRRRIPWLLLLGALAVLIFVNVGKGELRESIKAGEVGDSTTEVSTNWLEYANQGFTGRNDQPLENSAWRFANSDLLGYVAVWVPDRYPYYGYSPYTELPTLLVPRALAPDKPAFGFANEFGRRYELISSSDFITSVNTPFHVEALVAGGYLPLAIVGLFVGLYYRLLQRVFRRWSAAVLLTASIVCLQVVLSAESGILSIVLILPYALVLYPVMLWITHQPRAVAPPSAVPGHRSTSPFARSNGELRASPRRPAAS